ncbi:hypothetical protein [Streptomyces sp. NPDC000410]|uniref:hypothetical protein n=1 Tax=Streptomyces sp. NPDC000410 TaxID=3154254 RepID=UPI00332B92BB
MDRVLVTLAHPRLDLTHAALAELFDVDRCIVTKAIGEIRPLPAALVLLTLLAASGRVTLDGGRGSGEGPPGPGPLGQRPERRPGGGR